MNQPATLETERLILRQWRDEDYAPFAAMNADPAVMRYFPAPLLTAESNSALDRYRALITRRGWGFWAVETKTDGAFIGLTGLHIPSCEMPFPMHAEIGWRLTAAAQGRGYATEAAKAALLFGFETLGLPDIVSFTAMGNARSRAVMERLGMRFAGIFDHPSLPEGHPLRKHLLYRLSSGEWRNAPARV